MANILCNFSILTHEAPLHCERGKQRSAYLPSITHLKHLAWTGNGKTRRHHQELLTGIQRFNRRRLQFIQPCHFISSFMWIRSYRHAMVYCIDSQKCVVDSIFDELLYKCAGRFAIAVISIKQNFGKVNKQGSVALAPGICTMYERGIVSRLHCRRIRRL